MRPALKLAAANDVVRLQFSQRGPHVTLTTSHEGLVGRELTPRPTHRARDELGKCLFQQPLQQERPRRLDRHDVTPPLLADPLTIAAAVIITACFTGALGSILDVR
jgi:hypothetical protein